MASNNNFLGIGSFKLGAPGDGVMGATLTEFKDIEVGSVTFEGSQQNVDTIPTEGSDSYITVNGDVQPTTVKARIFGVTPAEMVLLAGGEVDGISGLWNAPRTVPDIHLSLEMKGKANGGKRGVLEIPYGKIIARHQGTITKNGLPAVDITITANTPVSAGGVEGFPYSYGTEVA